MICRVALLLPALFALLLSSGGAHAAAPLPCAEVADTIDRLFAFYDRVPEYAVPEIDKGVEIARHDPPQRLDRNLLSLALMRFDLQYCGGAGWRTASAPGEIVIVDFARPSREPRLYAVQLATGAGLDYPVQVAHGSGSDPDDDGIADRFSNIKDSLMSSLGAARGGALYPGKNGVSLRLDGLDATNNAMRARDVVVHSYPAAKRRYFSTQVLADRGGKPGMSEGCFVVSPENRDWLFSKLKEGGFLFAGLGGARIAEMDGPELPSAPGE